jgi:hypothetical protein
MANFDINCDVLEVSSAPLKTLGIGYRTLDETNYVEPVTVEEFKLFAGIDFDTDDTLVAQMVKMARIQTEQYLKKSLGIRTVVFSAISCRKEFRLDWLPYESVTTAGFTIKGGYLMEGGENIAVEYITNADLVSEDIKMAIMIRALDTYQDRDRYKSRYRETGAVIDRWKELLYPYKKIQFP